MADESSATSGAETVESIPVPPNPQTLKSSDEILSELFGAFDATPPPLDDLKILDTSSIKSEKSHKKHKKEKKKKHKKEKKKKKRSSSSDSSDSKDSKKKSSTNKNKKHTSKSESSSSDLVNAKKKRKLGKFSASDTDSDDEEPSSKKQKSADESKLLTVKIKEEKDSSKSSKVNGSSTVSTVPEVIRENILKEAVSKIVDKVIRSSDLASEICKSINGVKSIQNSTENDKSGDNETQFLSKPIKQEPKENKSSKVSSEKTVNESGNKISPKEIEIPLEEKNSDEKQDSSKTISEPPKSLPVADVFAEDLIDCGIKKDELNPNPEKPKQSSGKIKIPNLKFSQVYEATVKQIEEEAKLKAEKYEEGEISESSEEERSPTPSDLSSSGSVEEDVKKPEDKKKHHRRHHRHRHHRRGSHRSRSHDKHRSRSRDKHRSRSRDKHRSRSRDKHRSRSRDKHRSRSRDKHRSRSRDKHKSHSHGERSHSSHHHKEGARDKLGDKDRDRDREKRRSRERSRDRGREKERSRDRKRSRERTKERSRSRDRKDRGRSRSKDRKERGRSRSKSKDRHRSKDRGKSRSKDRKDRGRSRSKSKDRHRSRSKDRTKTDVKHRSRSRDKKPKDRERSKERSRSRDKKPKDRERSKERKRSREKDGRRHDRTRTKSHEREKRSPVEKIDKQKLLEIARKNALNMLKNPSGAADQTKLAITSGGKTVNELTDFCKLLSKKDADGHESISSNTSGDESENEKAFHHPFQIKDRPNSIVLNIRNSVALPVKSLQEKAAEQSRQLRLQFPVSSGQQHRKTESEWIPVSPKRTEATPSTQVALVKPTTTAKRVFKDPPTKSDLDIGSIVSQRLEAIRRLQENPTDPDAISKMQAAQQHMQTWAESKQSLPGQFSGSTGVKVLSQAELASGYQAWARRDQLQAAAPVNDGVGMTLLQKMGWRPGEGLGKNKEGTLQPLLLEVKMDKKGLVAQEELPVRQPHQILRGKPRSLEGKHPVSLLNEYCSRRKFGPPYFELVDEAGPDHKKNFLFKVRVNGVEYKPAVGSPKKKQARAEAAEVCLKALGILPNK